MTTDPMREALEAAMRALYAGGHHWNCATDKDPLKVKTDCNCFFRGYRVQAERAINAALPILRAQFAEEILVTLNRDWTGGTGHAEANKMVSIAHVRDAFAGITEQECDHEFMSCADCAPRCDVVLDSTYPCVLPVSHSDKHSAIARNWGTK